MRPDKQKCISIENIEDFVVRWKVKAMQSCNHNFWRVNVVWETTVFFQYILSLFKVFPDVLEVDATEVKI